MSNWDKERMKEHLQKQNKIKKNIMRMTVKQSKKSKLHAARLKRQVMKVVREAYSAENDALPPMIYIRSKLDVLIHEDRLWP